MRSWSIHLCSIFGIRLEIHATFFALLGIIACVGLLSDGTSGLFWSLIFILLVFTCLVLHELGHSLVAQYYGVEVIRILLLPIGGMAQFQSLPREASKELAISIAGPVVNFALVPLLLILGGIPWELAELSRRGAFPIVDPRTLFQALLMVNLVMGLFNLLPIFPMDGGRVLRALLTYRYSYLKSTATAALVSKILSTAGIFAALFVLPAFGLGIAVIPALLFAFIYMAGNMEYRIVERKELLNDLYIGDLIDNDYSVVHPDCPVGEALREFDQSQARALMIGDERETLFGMLLKDHIEILREESFLHGDPIGRHCERNVSLLQAQWPLDLFYEMLVRNRKKVFPVYAEGRLVGILDTERLQEKLAEHGVSAKRLGLPG